MRNYQISLFDENEEYDDFVEKFIPKKTTDDCYTPPPVYEAVLSFAVKEYALQGRKIVRPFYPDGDYEAYPYPDNCVVIDNPPFSILANIIDFYNTREIDYFLFAPSLTVASTAGTRANIILSCSSIVYENGAVVQTAFVTNLGSWKIHVSSELHDAVKAATEAVKNKNRKKLPKYSYPDAVLAPALIEKIARTGQALKIPAEECCFIRALDHQKNEKKALFGGGFILSEKAAAEKAAAEKAAAEKAAAEKAAAEKTTAHQWLLSERELAIIARMSHHNN